MGETTVRSPWNSKPSDPRRGETCSYSNPSSADYHKNRSDSGHIVRSPGKGPSVRRRDSDNQLELGGNAPPFSAFPTEP